MKNNEHVKCHGCLHFYVTWDKSFPNGCRLFGFKTRRIPSALVKEATGKACENYAAKPKEPGNS